jgi:predicted anti-sigma-YlaC factor YlaD
MKTISPGLLPMALVLVVLSLAGSGCSVRKMAANKIAGVLSTGGTTMASDNDLELVRDAVPFSLKLMESVLAETPEHKQLLAAMAGGFTQYSYAFVQQEADEVEGQDFARASAMRSRARNLFLRAHEYGLRGLEAGHRGFTNKLKVTPREAVRGARKADVPLLYWSAASLGAAISLSKDRPDTLARIPQMEALIDRALELDESWDRGAIHSFLINLETSRQGGAGDPAARARKHYERAVELSGGSMAGPMVTYAEAVCIQKQDVKQFEAVLQRALAIDVDAHPECRLANLVMQRRARWLLDRKEELFLLPEPSK